MESGPGGFRFWAARAPASAERMVGALPSRCSDARCCILARSASCCVRRRSIKEGARRGESIAGEREEGRDSRVSHLSEPAVSCSRLKRLLERRTVLRAASSAARRGGGGHPEQIARLVLAAQVLDRVPRTPQLGETDSVALVLQQVLARGGRATEPGVARVRDLRRRARRRLSLHPKIGGALRICSSPFRSWFGAPKTDPERYFVGTTTFLAAPTVCSEGRALFAITRSPGHFKSKASHAMQTHMKFGFAFSTVPPSASYRGSPTERCRSTCLLKWQRSNPNATRFNSGLLMLCHGVMAPLTSRRATTRLSDLSRSRK